MAGSVVVAALARRLASRGSGPVCHLRPQATDHRQRRCASSAGLQGLVRKPEQRLPLELQHAAQLMVDAGCKHAWPVASGHAHLLWWDKQEAGKGDTIKATPCWKSAPTLSACQASPIARMPVKPICIRRVCLRAFHRCHRGRLDPTQLMVKAQRE